MRFLRMMLLVGGLSVLTLVAWMAVLRAGDVSESNMVVFVSYRSDDTTGIYIMTAEGSTVRRIFIADDSRNWIDSPAWSPDGERIAFSMSGPETHFTQIYRVRVDGGGLQKLTEAATAYSGPNWSPDGQQIVFHDGSNVFTIHADGSEFRQLTQDGYNLLPAWSPDGERIVFGRVVPDQTNTYSIYQMQADGSELEMLTSDDYDELNPTFSPDGAAIIFASRPGDNRQAGYYRMRLSDEAVVMLDDPFRQHVSVDLVEWSASGEWAVYADETRSDREIWRIRADGSGAGQVTDNESEDLFPAWSPPISLAWRGWLSALVGLAMLVVGVGWPAPKNAAHAAH